MNKDLEFNRSPLPLEDSGLSFSRDPLGVYVHVPFCAQRCGYCNFSLVADRDYLIERFLDCLNLEIEAGIRPFATQPPRLQTLFLGGGTPTHLRERQLEKLFSILSTHFELEDDAEVTIEANPNDLPRCHEFLQTAGVTRISLGAQSFDSEKLQFLERSHMGEDVRQAVEIVRPWIPSISIDLIFGVAGESMETWQQDLRAAFDLEIDHLSTYGLTVEKGTSFGSRQYRGENLIVDDDRSATFYDSAMDLAAIAGFNHYEVSSFAKPNHRCRHNQTYWNLSPYWAFGPGAASFDGQTRRRNHQGVLQYIKQIESGWSPRDFEETLDKDLLSREKLIFGMRQMEGVEQIAFQDQTGTTPEDLVGRQRFQDLLDRKLIELVGGNIRLTRQGILLSDSIWVEFL